MELFRQGAISPEVLAEIRRLHFHTKRLANEGVVGQYRSVFRGRGVEFDEVREYQPGDDIRTIDWKVTARQHKPFVKMFREERELTVMIAVDVSSSTQTGTKTQLRERLLAQVGALLTLIALRNNDKVGLVTFDSQPVTYHPPRKARSAVWRILHEVLVRISQENSRVIPNNSGTSSTSSPPSRSDTRSTTDLAAICRFLQNTLKRPAIIFLLSDFYAPPFEQELSILNKKHDVTAFQVIDPFDSQLPSLGLIEVYDRESQTARIIDTSSATVRKLYRENNEKWQQSLRMLFLRHNIGHVLLNTDTPFMPAIANYFTSRSMRR